MCLRYVKSLLDCMEAYDDDMGIRLGKYSIILIISVMKNNTVVIVSYYCLPIGRPVERWGKGTKYLLA